MSGGMNTFPASSFLLAPWGSLLVGVALLGAALTPSSVSAQTSQAASVTSVSAQAPSLAAQLAPPPQSPAPARVLEDEAPSPFHVDFDLGYSETRTRFFVASDAVDCPEGLESVCAEFVDDPPEVDAQTLRGTIGVGFGILTLEGSAMLPVQQHVQGEGAHIGSVLSAGLRIDTGWQSIIALSFRFAYVHRTGDYEGEGGRAGIGLLVRPTQMLSIYGEASVDATTVPETMSDRGAIFSYATMFGGGLRLAFGH